MVTEGRVPRHSLAERAGVVLVAMMWAAVWPLAQHASDGSLTGSTNPFVDEHVMVALALIVIGVEHGSRLGLGALWASATVTAARSFRDGRPCSQDPRHQRKENENSMRVSAPV